MPAVPPTSGRIEARGACRAGRLRVPVGPVAITREPAAMESAFDLVALLLGLAALALAVALLA